MSISDENTHLVKALDNENNASIMNYNNRKIKSFNFL